MFIRALARLGVVWLSCGLAAWAAPPRPAGEWLEDAALNDVFFLDPDRGWAVGDRGAIWRTDDGGRLWRLQESPVGCRLHGVWFLDGENGWAVGGWTHPYTHKSSGVVLRTQDGGQSWKRLPSSATPALRRIRMFDTKHGWALGAPSALFPAAVYRTEDGGRGWATVAGGRPQGWETGDFRDAVSGVIAGRGGVALVGMNRFQPAPSPLGPQHVVRQVRLAEQSAAWLVGDAGLVLHSRNGGATWGQPPGPLPSSAELFDFQALAVWGPQVWIAGAPGTRVLHSPDGGATWGEFPTDQSLPIRAMTFLDEHHGWAVGELGLVLATRDGGRTWMRQRGGGARLAVLGLFAEPQGTPWEAFVRLSGSEGYLSGAEYVLDRGEAASSLAELSKEDRTREAMLAAGGNAAVVSADQYADPSRLEERLVRKIRQWRPEVLLTDPVRTNDPLMHALGQAVLNAASAASDPAAFPEHATLGLEPWTVKKVYSVQPPGKSGSLSIVTASLAPQFGGTLADGAAAARALFEPEFHPPPVTVELQLLIDRLPNQHNGSDITSGLNLPTPSEARRRLTALSAGSLDLVAKSAQKQRNIQQVLAHSLQQSGEAVVGQVDELIRDFPEATAGDMLFQLAERLRRQGRPDLASEIYARLVQRHPQHGASEAATLRLVQYFASSEAAAQEAKRAEIRRGVGEGVPLAAFTAPVEGDEQPEAPPWPQGATIHLRDAAATSAEADRRQRDAQALAWGHAAAKNHSALYAEPSLRFALAAAERRQGNTRDAERYFRQFSLLGSDNLWRSCAEGELWLMEPGGAPPKKIVRCFAAREKPYLDGKLDDAAWRGAAPIELSDDPGGMPTSQENSSQANAAANVDSAAPAVVFLTRDEEYLYFAVRCRKIAGAAYEASDQPRTYDAPLENFDRVELRIDLDRDYATYYRLTVDHRGWTGEACLGDAAWNPEWHVAASADEETWTVEAAIPFRELTSQPPARREVWAAGVRRIAPAAGLQSWTAPAASHVRPEGFGYVVFE